MGYSPPASIETKPEETTTQRKKATQTETFTSYIKQKDIPICYLDYFNPRRLWGSAVFTGGNHSGNRRRLHEIEKVCQYDVQEEEQLTLSTWIMCSGTRGTKTNYQRKVFSSSQFFIPY